MNQAAKWAERNAKQRQTGDIYGGNKITRIVKLYIKEVYGADIFQTFGYIRLLTEAQCCCNVGETATRKTSAVRKK